MTTIQEIYNTYTIPPRLQKHMYRVAGVGRFLSMYTKEPIDQESIVSACLLHDMGNIIKFNLDVNPAADISVEENDYRKQVQQHFIKTYGNNEKEAHRAICEEITHNKRLLELIEYVGMSKLRYHIANFDLEARIINYADMRVAPHGIVSMQERLQDGFQRYKRKYTDVESYQHYCKERTRYATQFEDTLFQHLTTTPREIIQESIEDLIRDLPSFELAR